MRRRTLIKSALAVLATLPVPGLRAWAQTASFPGRQEDPLKRLAETVLPASLGRAGTDEVSDDFTDWVRGYREGAEMSPGYGSPTVRYKGPSPAAGYEMQLQVLSRGALVPDDLNERRRRVADVLNRAGIEDIARVPQGENVVSDLMSFHFFGTAAHDRAYSARIGKDLCRTLENSGEAPRPLEG